MFQLATGLMAEQSSGRVKYASASQDPLVMASADHGRSRMRRRHFRLAFGHLQSASVAVENGLHRNAAATIVMAFYLSEGFAELSERYCSLLLNEVQPLSGGTVHDNRLTPDQVPSMSYGGPLMCRSASCRTLTRRSCCAVQRLSAA